VSEQNFDGVFASPEQEDPGALFIHEAKSARTLNAAGPISNV
jgi:hypothetical protein